MWNFSGKIQNLTQTFFFYWFVKILQSGTKPNLVTRIWPPTLVTICEWLPKLVANVSSQFHHLVNTGLTVGWFSCQMATNNGSPHLQIRHNLSGLYIADWKWLYLIVIAFNTLCPVQFYIHWCALEVNFLKKLPQLVALQFFQSSHLSHGESLNHNILSHYH